MVSQAAGEGDSQVPTPGLPDTGGRSELQGGSEEAQLRAPALWPQSQERVRGEPCVSSHQDELGFLDKHRNISGHTTGYYLPGNTIRIRAHLTRRDPRTPSQAAAVGGRMEEKNNRRELPKIR